MRISVSTVRTACAAAALLTLASTVFADPLVLRLYFRNETTGEQGIGPVPAIPGQVVSANWSFHDNPNAPKKSMWEILQAFIDLTAPGANDILTDADAATWDARIPAAFSPSPTYPVIVAAQPSDGPIYNNAVSPDDTTYPLVTAKGLYVLAGIAGSSPKAFNLDLTFFSFTVGAGSQPGEELHWGRDNITGQDAVATQMLWAYYRGRQYFSKVNDNWLVVAPTSSISGRVIFSNLAGMPPTAVTAFLTRSGQAGHAITLPLASDGGYILPLAADNYTLSVKGTHWLRKRISIAATAGDVPGQDLEMVNGDAYDDGSVSGKIDLFDISRVLSNMGETEPDPYADLDEDGAVTLTDLVIVLSGMGTVGDPA